MFWIVFFLFRDTNPIFIICLTNLSVCVLSFYYAIVLVGTDAFNLLSKAYKILRYSENQIEELRNSIKLQWMVLFEMKMTS